MLSKASVLLTEGFVYAASLLVISIPVTKSYGARSFQVAAAELWNGLPESVKDASTVDTFKKTP